MAAKTPPLTLDVFIGNVRAGTIVSLGPSVGTLFTFDDDYLADEARPVLSRGLLDAYGRPRRRPQSPGPLLPFFTNLLPEGDLRKYLAAHGGVREDDDFALLWLLGDDLPGAVTVIDPEGRQRPPLPQHARPLDQLPGRLFRFSLAGVQLKFSAVRNAHGGLTIAASGTGGNVIVKLPSVHLRDVPVNEYLMMRFAEAVGIDVPPCELVSLESIVGLPDDLPDDMERQAFVVRRFDRDGPIRRIHIEDFNQIYRQIPRLKYDNFDHNRMARDIYDWTGNDGLRAFIHRLVFNIAISNGDMHLKNWSLIYPNGADARLAPAYDYVCTSIYPVAGRDEIALNLGGTKTFNRIGTDTFERFAKRADLASSTIVTAAHEMRDRILTVWPTLRNDIAERQPQIATRIDQMLATVALFAI